MAELVIRPLERITEKLEVVSEIQVAQKHIEKRPDRTDHMDRQYIAEPGAKRRNS